MGVPPCLMNATCVFVVSCPFHFLEGEWNMAWCTVAMATVLYLAYNKVVSYPDSHVHPPEKRVWSLSKDFLVVLSQHVRKTGKPIRTLVRNKSCDIKTRSEHRPIPGSWNRSHYSRGCKRFRLREREQQCSKNAA